MARPNWEYVRVDVLLPSSHKLDDLTRSAKWTLVELWCHCGQHLTDGFVRDAVWRKTGTPRERHSIVAAGLAEPVTGGYQMHDYLDHQRSRNEVEALKKKRSDAGRKGGRATASAAASAGASASTGTDRISAARTSRSTATAHRETSNDQLSTGTLSPPSDGDMPAHPASDPKQVLKQNGSKSVAEAEAEAEAELVADVVTPTDPSSNYTSKNISLPYANGHLEGTKGRLALKPETLINETPKTRRKFRTEQERQLEALAQWQRENPQPEDTHGQPG